MKKYYCLFFALLSACGAKHAPLANSHYAHTIAPSPGNEGHDAFATYTVKTSAPTLTFYASTTMAPPFAELGQIIARVDDSQWRKFSVRKNNESFILKLDSLPGSHSVTLIESTQIRAHEQGEIGRTSLVGVEVPKGYRLDSLAKNFASGLVVWGDSRTVGGGCPIPAQQAWPVLLRRALPTTEIFTPGYGSLSLGLHIDTPEKRSLLVAQFVQRLTPYSQQKIWLEAGVNDYLTAAYTPTQLTAYYQALLTAIHAALPAAKIYLQTDVRATQEAANKAGFTLQQYRQAEANAGTGLFYVQVIEGPSIGTAADLSPDGVHLSVAGEERFMQRASQVLL